MEKIIKGIEALLGLVDAEELKSSESDVKLEATRSHLKTAHIAANDHAKILARAPHKPKVAPVPALKPAPAE